MQTLDEMLRGSLWAATLEPGQFEEARREIYERYVPLGGHATGAEPPTQESPAIDEDDPRIAGLVRQLSSTPLSKAKRDAAIRRHLAALEKNVRV